MIIITTLPDVELLGQDNNTQLFAWGSRHRFAPSHLPFLSPDLGINLFVGTAAGNQVGKGTAGVRNAGISSGGTHTDHTLPHPTSSRENMQSDNNALHFYSACLWQLSGSLQTLMNSQRQRFREYKGQKGL